MPRRARPVLLIKRHDVSDLVELSDGSKWRIWPGDISTTLGRLPNTPIEISGIDDDICSHVLISRSDQSQRVRVIKASAHWPAEKVRRSLHRALFNGRTHTSGTRHRNAGFLLVEIKAKRRSRWEWEP
jgi:hypothetical protein